MKLTAEELAAKIQQIIVDMGMEDPGVEAILSEIEAMFGEDAEPEAEGGKEDPAPEEDGVGENAGGDIDNDVISKIVQKLMEELQADTEKSEGKSAPAPDEQKGSKPTTEQKSAVPERKAAPQRKYRDLFIRTDAQIPAGQNSFKSRASAMTGRERNKYVFGMFGRAVKCIHASHGDPEQAAFTAERKFHDAEMAREFKALSATVPADGGYLVPEVYADEIIELLYPATVIYSLGARRLGMANGNLNIPKIKTGSRAMFTGENRSIPKTAPKFGNLKLSAKKLTALIPMSNDLLRSTNFDNDVIVGQDVTKQMALGVDYGALLGTGGEFQPLGILRNKSVLNIDVSKLGTEYASANGAVTAMFPSYLVAAVLKNNVYADGLGFSFNTSVEQYFKSLRDNVGGFIFAEEMSKGTLAGYPYKATNLITTGDDGKTSIAFGNWNDLVIGEQGALEIETSREGAWTDDYGNIVSAFENDQTIIRAINHVDTGLRHEESFAVAKNIAVPV